MNVVRDSVLILLFILLQVQFSYAQSTSGSFGNVFIADKAQLSVFGQHSFKNGGSGILPGIVKTTRDSVHGYMSFIGNAGWTGAADSAHVDGYVKTYMTTPFIFPIGNNGYYRPAAISGASSTNTIDAAYYWGDPGLASSDIGGPFSTDNFSTVISQVSNTEYWDINGDTATFITLSWNENSNIAALTNNQLCLLTIAGWDSASSQWVVIPSAYDPVSLLDNTTPSVLDSGTITTRNAIIPDTYSVYTLASLNSIQISGNDSICTGNITQLSVNNQISGTTSWVSRDPLIASVDSTGKVEGISAGTTTIAYTNANGCRDSVSITVFPLPTAVISDTSPEICQGQSVPLNFTFTGSSPWTVTFTYGNNNTPIIETFSAASSQYTVFPQETTTYTITTVADGNECITNY